MTVEASPAVIQANTYSAEIIRRMVASDLKRGSTIGSVAGGLVGATDLAISLNGTTKVNVAPGECWVPGTNSASTTQSGYYFRCSATETLTPAENAGSNPRVDAIVAKIKDAAYTGEPAENKGELVVEKGNAKATGATLAALEGAPGQTGGPALANNCLVLGYVVVPASKAAITEFLNVAQPALITNGRFVSTGSNITAYNLDQVKATGNITVTLPGPGPASSPGAPVAGAEVTIFANNHTVKVKPGSGTISGSGYEAASEATLTGYQIATLISDGTNWFLSTEGVGPWTNLTLGAKLESTEAQVRLENGGTVARLRGFAQVKTGQTLGEGETIFTIPSGFRASAGGVLVIAAESGDTTVWKATLCPMGNTSNGIVTVKGASPSEKYIFWLNGISYAL